jgi:hypothetical protein
MKRNGRVIFADRGGMGAGKGDAPRNLSPAFFANYDKVDWSKGCEAGCSCILHPTPNPSQE